MASRLRAYLRSEVQADHVLGAFKTQHEAIDWAKKAGHALLSLAPAI
jgi:hypothetical protein